VAEVATALLTERGHSVIHTETADEALDMLATGVNFDLAFTDLAIPGPHDGLDLSRIIRQKWPALPVLVATGHSEAANRATEEDRSSFKALSAWCLADALQENLASHRRPTATNVIPLTRNAK
jgi:CheY-like chemotaxis protein